jgi:PAS domain S-box-containing protein
METGKEAAIEGNGAGVARQDRLWFLESMDRINRTIQGTDDFEQMSHVLDALLSIFHCDRSWIVYPCDAESRTWRMVAERARREFASAVLLGPDIPMDAEVAHMHRVVRASQAAVRFGPGATNPVPSGIAERFGVQSLMCLAVYPRTEKPYILGLDQCTRATAWTQAERDLFEAAGQRLAILLTSLSMSRDLQESKARLEEAQRVAHVGHWEWDLETDVVIWSDETYRIFGLRPQERPMDLAAVRAMVHPDDRESLYSGVDENLVAGLRPDAEFRIVLPSGEERTVHALTSKRWTPTPGDSKRDALGRPYKLFGTVQDITDRKRTEEALRQSQAHFREAQRLAHMGNWTSDGLVCKWSDQLFEIYGLDPRNGVPTTEKFLSVIHPHDRTAMDEAIKMMLERQRSCDVTTRVFRSDGDLRYIRCVGIPIVDHGVFKGFLGTSMDVTEQELLTMELRRERAYFAEAQSLAHIGSWATNFDTGQIFHVSDETVRLHGFDPRQGPIPLDRFYATIHPEDVAVVMATLKEAIRTRTDYDIREFRISLPDGTIRFLRTIGHQNPSGEIGEYIGITMDITERKRAEEERERLRQLEADLAHINRVNMMGELAAALAHEIKQPIAASITSANACLRWLAHDPPDLERARAAAARMERDGNRAADVINSLRSFYKTGTSGDRKMVDVNGVIEEMTGLLGTEAARHSITIRAEFESDMPQIRADRVQLQQAFMNLMLNAIEAMKDTGGELTIRSRVNAEGQLTVSIGDTGVGLPAESADRIFDPFHTTKPQGTGMGLPITRSIVESYGGRLWATSNPGVGATFHFTLPQEAESH